MLSGFNTNVRHRGVRFHVQTEDSGLAHPHVITHLYHGGTIVASQKSDYADRVGHDRLGDELRELMQRQHAAMLERLRRGELDAAIEERLGPGLFGPGAPSAPDSAGEPTRSVPAPVPHATAPSGDAAPAAAAEVPDRPLDELILDYLVESARKRKRRVQ